MIQTYKPGFIVILLVIFTLLQGCAINRATANIDPTTNLSSLKVFHVKKNSALAWDLALSRPVRSRQGPRRATRGPGPHRQSFPIIPAEANQNLLISLIHHSHLYFLSHNLETIPQVW